MEIWGGSGCSHFPSHRLQDNLLRSDVNSKVITGYFFSYLPHHLPKFQFFGNSSHIQNKTFHHEEEALYFKGFPRWLRRQEPCKLAVQLSFSVQSIRTLALHFYSNTTFRKYQRLLLNIWMEVTVAPARWKVQPALFGMWTWLRTVEVCSY